MESAMRGNMSPLLSVQRWKGNFYFFYHENNLAREEGIHAAQSDGSQKAERRDCVFLLA
jgi:hypothetical protein